MPKKLPEVSHTLWSAYNQAKLSNGKIIDQTSSFFSDSAVKKIFDASTRRIVQFGAGVGTFISSLTSQKRSDWL